MLDKDKQELNKSKQSKDLTYLMVDLPRWFNLYNQIAERLNSKELTTPMGKKYTYQTVFQCIKKNRWYDPNIHHELAIIRKEYLEKQKEIKVLESIEA